MIQIKPQPKNSRKRKHSRLQIIKYLKSLVPYGTCT